MHRSRANGGLYIIVPGKLILFRTDYDDDAPSWRDRGHVREFSTGFYASLLADLDACAVLRLGPPAYDPAPFVAAGLAHLDLGVHEPAEHVGDAVEVGEAIEAGGGGEGEHLLTLRAMDRLAAVMDAANGRPVAVHFAADADGGHGCAQVAGLIAAHLTSRRLLGPREAAAWLSLAWPVAAAAGTSAGTASEDGVQPSGDTSRPEDSCGGLENRLTGDEAGAGGEVG